MFAAVTEVSHHRIDNSSLMFFNYLDRALEPVVSGLVGNHPFIQIGLALKFQDALNRMTKSQFATVDRLYRSEDQQEGAKAFAEGRDPGWKGR